MESQDLEQRILQHVNQANYKAVKPTAIGRKLRLSAEEQKTVRVTVKRLVKKKKLKYGPRHLVLPVQQSAKERAADTPTDAPIDSQNDSHENSAPAVPTIDRDTEKTKESVQNIKSASAEQHAENTILGTFSRAAGGFGFVRPAGTDRAVGRDHDIFIAAHDSLAACQGDTVRIQVGRPGRSQGGAQDHNQTRGRVIEIITRVRNQFIGTYREKSNRGSVSIDGNQFERPIPVGDAGAKRAAIGDKVVIEMVRFPSGHDNGEAVLTEVLGTRGEPGVDTQMILHEFMIRQEFPEDVLDDARDQASQFDENNLTDRDDLTAATIITIDPVDARDFDDAISLEQIENGHWRLGVHIADVAHFVPVGSKLDVEAKLRATSVYLPDLVVPMLPEIISNNLASLQPDRNRYATTAIIEFNAEGIPIATDVKKTVIRSCRRFTYEEIDDFLDNRSKWQENLDNDVYFLLDRMHELAMLLRGRRLEHGSLEVGLPEIKIDLDGNGEVAGAHRTVNTESHQIIEESMLAANQAVATLLNDRELKFLRRIHPDPTKRKLVNLTKFAREIGIKTDDITSRFQIQEVVNQSVGKPYEQAVGLTVLRSLQKAIYGCEEERHYALNFTHYCHFTSPIRRYPDLTIHRLLNQVIAAKPIVQDIPKITELGDHCSDREVNAERAERELKKLKLLNYLDTRKGEEMVVLVTGVEKFGLFVQGVQVPASGLIHVATLRDDHYSLEQGTHVLVGYRSGNSFRLGDTLSIRIGHIDHEKREANFIFLNKIASADGNDDSKPLRPTQSSPSKKKGQAGKRKGSIRRGGKKRGSARGKRRR
ncbi:MAG: VacB/RNase II family 3'-5' exoribonuclease [Planctomycetaceae bacterium]|nr:VacB/RNase II family 3'-5' exoribonuclease [Planctomycetaceae bacterium]